MTHAYAAAAKSLKTAAAVRLPGRGWLYFSIGANQPAPIQN